MRTLKRNTDFEKMLYDRLFELMDIEDERELTDDESDEYDMLSSFMDVYDKYVNVLIELADYYGIY